jgi:hypothetical protein
MALGATVQLLNTLPEIVLCGNKIPLKFQASENLLAGEASKASMDMQWSAAAVADEFFDVTLKGQVIRFTCAVAPDGSGNQFHDNSLSAALDDWCTLVAQDMAKNYLISRYYDIEATGSGVINLTAKEEGTIYTLDFTAGTGIDCVKGDTQEGIDISFTPFYSIVVLVYCDDSLVTELLLNVDEEGVAETDISDILKAYLDQEFQWPESDSQFIFECPGAILPFYFLYGEKWGADEYQGLQTSNAYYVIEGGLSWLEKARLNLAENSFWDLLQQNKYFLSWAPATKKIASDEPVKFYYLNYSEAGTLNVKVKLYGAAGDTTITHATISGLTGKGIYEIIVSPDMAGFEGLDDEALLKFDIWIEDGSNAQISEIRTFELDYAEYEHTRYFMFKNSMGAYEFLRTTGLRTTAWGISRETASIDPEADYNWHDRDDLSIYNEEIDKFILAMGWLNRYGNADEYLNWLRDFANSREVYEVMGDILNPIRITSDNLAAGEDRDSLKGFVFEYVNAYTDEHFTKELEPIQILT